MNSQQRRHEKSIAFLIKHVPNSPYLEYPKVLDLGFRNDLSEELKNYVWSVENTSFDLDIRPQLLAYYCKDKNIDVVTAFEVLEHLIEPAPVLRNIPGNKLIATVPMPRLFDKPYWNDDEPLDQHYHEFTKKQFDKLLNHCGWKVVKWEYWRSYSSLIGRLFNRRPKYYAVYAERDDV